MNYLHLHWMNHNPSLSPPQWRFLMMKRLIKVPAILESTYGQRYMGALHPTVWITWWRAEKNWRILLSPPLKMRMSGRNVSQKQTDAFLKLPIVSFFLPDLSIYLINSQALKHTKPTYGSNWIFLKKIDEMLTQTTKWTCDIITLHGNQLTDEGELVPSERLELWRHDPVECMKELMGNLIFENSLEYTPQKHFMKGGK